MTAAEAAGLWAVLAAAFYNPQPPHATRLLYVEELQEIADVTVAAAAVRALVRSERSFMPTVGEIRAEYWRRQQRAREQLERAERRRALPAGERDPIPPEVLAQLEGFGVDVTRLTKAVDPGKAA